MSKHPLEIEAEREWDLAADAQDALRLHRENAERCERKLRKLREGEAA